MAVGFRIFSEISRPDKALIALFEGIPVANLGDNMGRLYCMDASIKPYNSRPLLGSAITVKVPAGDNLMFHKAIGMAQPGDIIVVDGEGSLAHALCGEIMMREAIAKGVAGFVVDGAIRDVEALAQLPISVYARGVQPRGPYKNGPGEIGVPVAVGGLVVMPGDILVGDEDGIVVVRPSDAPEVAQKGRQHSEMEGEKFKKIAAGTLDKGWVDKSLTSQGCEIL